MGPRDLFVSEEENQKARLFFLREGSGAFPFLPWKQQMLKVGLSWLMPIPEARDLSTKQWRVLDVIKGSAEKHTATTMTEQLVLKQLFFLFSFLVNSAWKKKKKKRKNISTVTEDDMKFPNNPNRFKCLMRKWKILEAASKEDAMGALDRSDGTWQLGRGFSSPQFSNVKISERVLPFLQFNSRDYLLKSECSWITCFLETDYTR